MKLRIFLVVLTILAVSGCADSAEELDIFSNTYDFGSEQGDWVADYTDYAISENTSYDSLYNWQYYYGDSIQTDAGRKVIMLSCTNVSRDVFMFIKKKVSGLKPNSRYNLVFDIAVASNSTAGEGIILKAGASDLEPKKIIEGSNYLLNLDKGSNLSSGENLISFGDIGNTQDYPVYHLVDKNNANSYTPLVVKSNSKGEIWLIVGTDSVREGTNTVVYSRINVVFSATK